MKNAFYFPVSHDATFGERLTALRQDKGIKSVQALAEAIFEKFDKYEKSDSVDINIGTIESIRKRIASHLKENCNPKMEFIKEYCVFFDCDAGFLLGYIDFPTQKSQNVYELTGLNDKALEALNLIQLTDKNENSVTVFPHQLFKKMYSNEELTNEELAQVENIFFDSSDKYRETVDNHRPLLMDILNFMLANGSIEDLVKQFRNFINARFTVPVYYDNDKSSFIYPDNPYSYTGDTQINGKTYNGTYILNFASSKDEPNDNAPIFLSNTFFDTVTLKEVERIFYEMRDDYEQRSDD